MRKRGILKIVSKTEDDKPWLEVKCMRCGALVYFEYIASPVQIEINVFNLWMKKHRCQDLKEVEP